MKRIVLTALLLAAGCVVLLAQTATDPLVTALTNAGYAPAAAQSLANTLEVGGAASQMSLAMMTAIQNQQTVDENKEASDVASLRAAQTPHITEYTIETATGTGGSWALTSTESEMFGTRRMVSFQNVKQFRLCFNLGAGGGPGAAIHLDESYDWTITSADGTWTQILGPIDISTWRVGCTTPWTPYTGNQVDAFVRIRGSSPNPAAAQFMNIALEVQ